MKWEEFDRAVRAAFASRPDGHAKCDKNVFQWSYQLFYGGSNTKGKDGDAAGHTKGLAAPGESFVQISCLCGIMKAKSTWSFLQSSYTF